MINVKYKDSFISNLSIFELEYAQRDKNESNQEIKLLEEQLFHEAKQIRELFIINEIEALFKAISSLSDFIEACNEYPTNIDWLYKTELDQIIIQLLENDVYNDALIVTLNLIISILQRINLALQFFRNEKFIQIIAKISTNKVDDCMACILKVIYLLVNDSPVEIHFLIINHFPLINFLRIVENSIDQEIHMRIAMILFAFSKHALDSDNTKYALQLTNQFLVIDSMHSIRKYLIWTIWNIMLNRCLDYPFFIELDLLEFIRFELMNPPIDTQDPACRIISLLYDEYNCDFQFSVESILGILFNHASEKAKISASLALNSFLSKYSYYCTDLVQLFIIPQIVNLFPDVNVLCKVYLAKVICQLLDYLTINDYDKIPLDSESNIFTILNDLTLNGENEMMYIAIRIIIKILKYGILIHQEKRIIELFQQAVDQDILDDFDGADPVLVQEFNDIMELYLTSA